MIITFLKTNGFFFFFFFSVIQIHHVLFSNFNSMEFTGVTDNNDFIKHYIINRTKYFKKIAWATVGNVLEIFLGVF